MRHALSRLGEGVSISNCQPEGIVVHCPKE